MRLERGDPAAQRLTRDVDAVGRAAGEPGWRRAAMSRAITAVPTGAGSS
ncbi:MAG TPA: hypothetical protein VH502_15715 [Actinoplanes sp.]